MLPTVKSISLSLSLFLFLSHTLSLSFSLSLSLSLSFCLSQSLAVSLSLSLFVSISGNLFLCPRLTHLFGLSNSMPCPPPPSLPLSHSLTSEVIVASSGHFRVITTFSRTTIQYIHHTHLRSPRTSHTHSPFSSRDVRCPGLG